MVEEGCPDSRGRDTAVAGIERVMKALMLVFQPILVL
jgi:hypothetical protein